VIGHPILAPLPCAKFQIKCVNKSVLKTQNCILCNDPSSLWIFMFWSFLQIIFEKADSDKFRFEIESPHP
jgi:hypothetical protein